MRIVYIAGPYRGATAWDIEQNIRIVEEMGLAVACRNMIPLMPHTMFRYFQGTLLDHFWIHATGELLKRCDAILFTGRWEHSSGCQGELRTAEEWKIPAFTSLNELVKWNQSKP